MVMILPLSLFSVTSDKHGIITKKSSVDVKTTMDRLEMIIKQKGLTLFARINHKENAKNAGGAKLNDAEVIIFGNPKVELRMLTRDPKAGLDLPFKMSAYKAKDGNIYLSYRDPRFYAKIYDLYGCKSKNTMSILLNKLSDKVTLPPKDFKALSSSKKP
jgi:uncharacterized protein (DUF302 family)